MTGPSSRMLTLLSLLQTRRDWPGHVLADRLAVSGRTVRRDVDRLRELGYRIDALKGPDGGYRLDAGAELPPLLFDDDQALALAVALRQAAVAGGAIGEGALRALATVRQVLPSRLRHRLDGLAFTTLGSAGDAPPVDPDALLAATAAVRAREVLRFDHASPEDASMAAQPPRRVEPHHVVAHAGRWYLVAFDLDRDDWRVFRLDRLRPRTPTGPRFTPRALPEDDIGTFLTGRFRGAAEGDRWPCVGAAVLHLPAHAAAPFVTDGVVEPLDEDRCRLVVGSWSWVALAASLGRFDAAISQVEPRELADACALLARRMGDAAGGGKGKKND